MYNSVMKTDGLIKGLEIIREIETFPLPEIENEPTQEEENSGNMLHMTTEEFEKELEISYQKGFHEGELQGYKKCEKELKPNLQLFNDVVQAMEQQRAEFLHKSQTFMVTLAGKIAKKITQTELKFNTDIIKKIVGKLVKRVLDDEEIVIYLNPGDAPVIAEYKSELMAMNPQMKRISIESDPKITPGGCIVETKSGILDSRLDEMFAEIEKVLTNHFNK